MSYQQQRPPLNLDQRLNELLDAIKQEFDQVKNEAFRLHKDESEGKYNKQVAELRDIRNTVYNLQQTHERIKRQYEEDISRLKAELEQRDRQSSQLQYHNQQNAAAQTQQSPTQLPPPQTPQLQQQQPPNQLQTTQNGAQASNNQPNQLQTNQQITQAPNSADSQQSISDKPIPTFLKELDAQLVPEQWKKQTHEFYVLYNPALPKTLDVDLVHSFDHNSVVCCVRFSRDGKYLATGCNKSAQIYGVESGQLVARLTDDGNFLNGTNGAPSNAANPEANSGDLYIRAVTFSPDGKYLATGAEDKLIRIWDLSSRSVIQYLKGHEQDIYSLDYFPDGTKLVSGSGDKSVRIWDLNTSQTSLTLAIEDGVTTVAVSPDSSLIAAGSLDRIVRVWNASSGFLVDRLDGAELNNGHKDSVYSVQFTHDGKEITSGSLDTTVKLWALDTNKNGATNKANVKCEVTYRGHKDFVLSVCSTPDNEYILSGSKDRGVIFWDKNSGDPLFMLQGHRNSVISVCVSNNGIGGNGYFATGSGDCKARIWKYKRDFNQ
ncbi:chromatin-silencing transcriptional regulator TUP1 [Ascoidea rubescens DSM 1968]|uniref:WD40 repeat-like protein n=1 Tax=Ascoidea rubescens DSM 1968 TaxID=1344418 RepID=A0A1D2VHK8_9ASCO|nr:WD40 repeat-like protein [Ascoidea rubescens DSM 1968]ODV61144.1 WD40 repeat-like protein [Ascoidea rubescens DSM 1968]